jgi:DNA polymerase-4
LPVRKINGIGPKAGEKLLALGIASIGDLARTNADFLVEHFGPGYGVWLHEAANGIDDRPVVTHSEPKSVSRETTFERDLHPRRDRAELSEIFTSLCARVAEDLRRKGCLGRTIGIKLRFDDFRTVTRDLTLPTPVADAALIRRAAGECLRRVPLDRRLRLLGVRVGGLCTLDVVHEDAPTPVPPTVRPSMRSVGWPTPTGTLWPSLPQVPTPGSMARSLPIIETRFNTSGPLPIRVAPFTGVVILPFSIR